MATARVRPHTCWICNTTISLEMCTFDAQDLPVHGACLTAIRALDQKIKPPDACAEPIHIAAGHAGKVLS
jgi:hypothetical protein